jgi:uncharacterized delta-60 repeat protein
MRVTRIWATSVLIGWLCLPLAVGLAAPGDLDADFGGLGIGGMRSDGRIIMRAMALQPDGKFVVAGHVTTPTEGDNYMLARFEPNGAFDCFNVVDFDGGNDQALAVAIAPDQTIVAAGQARSSTVGTQIGITRFRANCAVERTFGVDGNVMLGFGGGTAVARAALVQPDGRIVLAGEHEGNLALARQPDGKLLVAGLLDVDFLVARYHANGSLDSSFGTNGIARLDFDGFVDTAYALDVRADGKIVAAGCSSSVLGNVVRFAVAQLDRSGRPDTGFSGDGKVVTGFGSERACARGVGFAATDRVVAAGYQIADTRNFALASYQTVPQGPPAPVSTTYLPLVRR